MRILICILAVFICLPVAIGQEKSIDATLAKTLEVVSEKNKQGKFKGQVLKGKRNGMGLFAFKDGAVYVGDFYNDNLTGYGMMVASQGGYIENCDSCVAYVGNWDNGKKSGFGVCYADNGNILYKGQFSDDKPAATYPTNPVSGNRYFSLLSFDNGDVFMGEFKNGLPDGYGILLFANGDYWTSSFKEGFKKGIGLYTLYDGEWETMNFEQDTCSVISSSVEYKDIDKARKTALRNAMMQALSDFAVLTAQMAETASNIQLIKQGGSTVGGAGYAGDSYSDQAGSNASSTKGGKNAPYSLSANQSKNADSRTYAGYDSMLSKMRAGNMEYSDSKRREYQSKMRSLRQKWEQRGERFQHSSNEDWSGR